MGICIGNGKNGNCYLENGQVIKIYNNKNVLSGIPSEFVGLYNDTYVFPEKMILDVNTKKRIAAVFRYIDSLTLDKKDISIYDVIDSIDKCYIDTDKLSKQGIRTFDVYPKNMMYNNGIKIIDIDYYYLSDDKDLFEDNISDLNYGLGLLFFDASKLCVDCPKLIMNESDLFNLYNQTFMSLDNKTLKQFLICLKDYVQEEEQKEVKMVSEYKKILSR